MIRASDTPRCDGEEVLVLAPRPASISSRSYARLFFLCVGLYFLTAHGAIRSWDAEAAFKTAANLIQGEGFGLKEPPAGSHFGFAQGTGKRYYSVFAPLVPVLATPLVALGETVAASDLWSARESQVPMSLTCGISVTDYLTNNSEGWSRENLRRMSTLFFNVLIGSFLALVYARLVCRLTGSARVGLFGGACLAFATPFWHYAGTFFTEPMTTLLVVLSVDRLLAVDPRVGETNGDPARGTVLAGSFLGIACLSHITSVLWIPFLALLAGEISESSGRGKRGFGEFLLGMVPFLMLLGAFHHANYGSPFETGRTAPVGMKYAGFINPAQGLLGFLLAPSKGLILHCPLVILGLASWRRLHARHPSLSLCLLSAAAFRWIFIASRSDWHGGFCLGPRLILVVVPFLILPLLQAAASFTETSLKRNLLAGFTFVVLVAQQIHLVVGEVFLYLYDLRWVHLSRGVNLLENDTIYWDPASAVVSQMPIEPLAPWLPRVLGFSPEGLTLVLLVGVPAGVWWVLHGADAAAFEAE